MPPSLPQVEAQALQLSPQEREQLAERLLLSLDASTLSTWQAEWDEEIARRVAELDAGTAELIPADQVMAQMRQKLGQR
jgi:putative addiction module component (TIGR02574 family)